jgi:hypothetical protein
MRSRAMLVLLLAACGAAPGPRVAVLPEVWATTRPDTAAPAAPRITQTLGAHDVTAVADERSRAAIAVEGVEGDACMEDLACLRRVGERLGASKLVTLQLAELGETLAVQLTLVDVRRAAREATMREVVNPNEATRVAATLDVLGTRVARQAAPPRRSRAWLWLGAGGLTVGVAAVTLLVLASGGEDPDTTIVPP